MLTPQNNQKLGVGNQVSLHNIQEIETLIEIINKRGINKDNICLIGSTPLALFGIRENNDIDIAAIPSERQVIKEGLIAREDDGIELSKKNSLNIVNISDEELISNNELHFRYEGFKILPLEIVMSVKGAKRRPKDLDDIGLIYEHECPSDPEWEWDLVRVIPVWERQPSRNISLYTAPRKIMKLGLKNLQSKGVISTGVSTTKFIFRQAFAKNFIIPTLFNGLTSNSTLEISDLIKKHDSPYPLPYILAGQFSPDGEFQRHDLIAAILSLENPEEDYDVFENNYKKTNKIQISKSGKIMGGINQLAELIVIKNSNLVRNASEVRIPVEVSVGSSLKPTGKRWVENKFSTSVQQKILTRRQHLLEQSGVLFSVIVWPGVDRHFDEITKEVQSRLSIESISDYRVDHALQKFVEDVYKIDERNERWFLDKKIHELLRYEPKIRILTVQVPEPTFSTEGDQLMCEQVSVAKMEARKMAQNLISEYTYGTCVHATDTFEHNAHVQKIINRLENGYYTEASQTLN